ncbi:type II toxin-antitoxin system Phd/YefM family antitoxin [Streptomyces sp. ISL-90]|nr:type II toxin-antitoxin system Phd/YefM family antitoxin [Streptomyces sp. ISL-90]
MVAVNGSVTTRELRQDLASVLGRAAFGHERVGITRHGKLAAVVIGVDDLEALEAFEMMRDVEEFKAAKAVDDGERVSLADVRAELAE